MQPTRVHLLHPRSHNATQDLLIASAEHLSQSAPCWFVTVTLGFDLNTHYEPPKLASAFSILARGWIETILLFRRDKANSMRLRYEVNLRLASCDVLACSDLLSNAGQRFVERRLLGSLTTSHAIMDVHEINQGTRQCKCKPGVITRLIGTSRH